MFFREKDDTQRIVRMIPNVAHFIWFGQSLPWLHAMSLASAARAGGFDKLVLHHDGLSEGELSTLRRLPGLELRSVNPERAFQRYARSAELLALYAKLTAPAARANLLRAGILYSEGGVYLDMDVVTLKPLTPLLDAGVFCGAEPIAYPGSLIAHPTLRGYARAFALSGVRDVLRRLPTGPRWFARFAHLYAQTANNAVLGAEPGHAFMERLLDQIVDTPAERQLRRYALGTHVLQRTLAQTHALHADERVIVHPPAAFYPLGPVLSEHWFRIPARVDLDEVISPETYAVHWYASVRTKHWVQRMDRAFVVEQRGHQ
jgi:hypothetical protein